MAKKSTSGKVTEALADSRGASENVPMTTGEIATAVAKKKTMGPANKRATKTAAKKKAAGNRQPKP